MADPPDASAPDPGTTQRITAHRITARTAECVTAWRRRASSATSSPICSSTSRRASIGSSSCGFFGEKSQTEIAEIVGISQMHVSRLLRRSFELMRLRLDRSG